MIRIKGKGQEKMKEINIIDLNEEQSEHLDNMLDEYDYSFIKFKLDGDVEIGIMDEGQLVAGLLATMTVYKIMYVSSVFVKDTSTHPVIRESNRENFYILFTYHVLASYQLTRSTDSTFLTSP